MIDKPGHGGQVTPKVLLPLDEKADSEQAKRADVCCRGGQPFLMQCGATLLKVWTGCWGSTKVKNFQKRKETLREQQEMGFGQVGRT